MGYSERPCRLCGVSFNIGRIRLPNEPYSSGFTADGDGRSHRMQIESPECIDSCILTKRKVPFKKHRNRNGGDEKRTMETKGNDREDDLTFVPLNEEFLYLDPLEFESDDEGTDGEDEEEDKDIEIEDEETFDGLSWFKYLTERPLHEIVEHVSGPHCKDRKAYSGNSITAEEMRGCNIFQCLIHKDRSPNFEPEPHDLDFELEGKFFLSGLSDHMPSRDQNNTTVIPERHGINKPDADPIVWEDHGNPSPWTQCIPFHPACFDIFIRLSTLRLGKIDIAGLNSWYFTEGDYKSYRDFPRDPSIKACSKQWWNHIPSTEYLAANPLFIPLLTKIFKSSISTDPSFSPQKNAFPPLKPTNQKLKPDIFNLLPEELRFEILTYLTSKDIANLRLSTRTFNALPITLFQHLLHTEIPSLFEISSTTSPPYIWTFISPQALRTSQSQLDVLTPQLTHYRQIIHEEMPELYDDWVIAEKMFLEGREDPMVEEQITGLENWIGGLPEDRTNWYLLYTEITRNWKGLKGLRNRERIWRDVERIVGWIGKKREEEGGIGEIFE